MDGVVPVNPGVGVTPQIQERPNNRFSELQVPPTEPKPQPVNGITDRRYGPLAGHPKFPKKSQPTIGIRDYELDHNLWIVTLSTKSLKPKMPNQDESSVSPRSINGLVRF